MRRLRLSDYLQKGAFYSLAKVELKNLRPDPAHEHDFIEIFWIESGTGWHWINGEQKKLSPGILHGIQEKDRHAFSTTADGPLRFMNLAFPSSVWKELSRRYFRGKTSFLFSKKSCQNEHLLSPAEREELTALSRVIFTRSHGEAELHSFLIGLQLLLERKKISHSLPEIPDWLHQACQSFRNPSHFAGGTRALARLAGRSPDHVARTMGEWLHKTPTEFVNEVRMQYASEKLSTTSEEIIAIAMDCGISNLSHFYKIFHHHFGMTPRKFRLKSRQIISGRRG